MNLRITDKRAKALQAVIDYQAYEINIGSGVVSDLLADRAEMLAEIAKLREYKADVEAATMRAMIEQADEKHCTCVPLLRNEIERMRAALTAYGRHLPACNTDRAYAMQAGANVACSCGYTDALETSNAKP